MPITPDVYDEIWASQIQHLREAAADHPAHTERLEALIKHYGSGGDFTNPPLDAAPGLSARVANMLDDDVHQLFWWREMPEHRQRQPLQYTMHMTRMRQLVADRKRREEAEVSLDGLLDLS